MDSGVNYTEKKFMKLGTGAVKEAIHAVLNESLAGKIYEHDKVRP